LDPTALSILDPGTGSFVLEGVEISSWGPSSVSCFRVKVVKMSAGRSYTAQVSSQLGTEGPASKIPYNGRRVTSSFR